MKLQPVTNQPNFSGRVVFEPKTTYQLTKGMPREVCKKIREVADLVSEKPYDVFISGNAQDSNFYDIAANTSFTEAQKVKEYTVKIQRDTVLTSIVDAAREAMEMYETFIVKGIKG